MTRPSDNLRYLTVRILTSLDMSTNWTGAGTGFLFVASNGDNQAPLLITNKHVIDGVSVIGITLHVTNDGNETPVPGPGWLLSVQTDQIPILRHPDPEVDLAAIGLAPVIAHVQQAEGWLPYIKCLDSSAFPDNATIAGMSALEEVVMIGYPTGLADLENNYPVVRRGITSTPYSANYRNKQEFLADIPVFGGSSGSPICIVNEGAYATADGLAMGHRFLFLGVLYAGHTETVNGQIISEPIPTNLRPVAKVTHMINLGICIKSRMIEDIVAQIPW